MSFSWGGSKTPDTSAPASASLFGSAGGNATGSSNPFGGASGTAGGSTGWTFGQTPTSGTNTGGAFGQTPTGTNTGGTFGQTPSSQASDNKPSGGLFGGGSGKSIFGQTSSRAPGTPSQPATSKSLFGSTTPASGTGYNFGANVSTTPAGQPPQQSILGASTGVSASQSHSQPTTSATSSGPVFGSGTTGAGAAGLFGNQKKDTTSSTPSFSFGQKPAGQSQAVLFGTTPASTQGSNAIPVFGAAKPTDSSASNTGVFGTQSNVQSSATTPAFSWGAPKKDDKPVESTSKPSFSFPALGTTPSTNFTPTNTSQPQTSSMFTSTNQSSQQPTTTSASGADVFLKPTAPASQTTKLPALSFPSMSSGSGPNDQQPISDQSRDKNASKPLFPNLSGASSSSAGTESTASKPLFGALGGTTTTSSSVPSTTATTGAAPFSGLFGSNSTSSTAAPGQAGTSTAAPLAGSLSFGPKSTAASTPALTAGSGPNTGDSGSNSGGSGPHSGGHGPTTNGSGPNLGTSTTGPIPPQNSRLRNKTMDDILTRWASDLSRYTKEFRQHADTIAQWDQIIVDNSQKIDKLYVKTRTCEKQTMSVEMQLTTVEHQQNELEAWLNRYEMDVEEMIQKEGSAEQHGADQEREATYHLAEKLGSQLDDMGRDLQSMIEEVNAANGSLGKSSKADEPITQIVKILNSHLSQLQAIDQGTSALQAKVMAAQNVAHGLSYMNGSINGNNHEAVDGFYRSYMGRR